MEIASMQKFDPDLKAMILDGRIDSQWSPLLETAPPPIDAVDLKDKVRGMMIGLAIGDALGNTSESRFPRDRQANGDIMDYLPNRFADGRKVGVPSDDTQMAFWTLEHLLERDCIDPGTLAHTFRSRPIYGMGMSVRENFRNLRKGEVWPEASAKSAGNGALMRIAPVLVPHLLHPTEQIWSDALLAATATHNDAGSNAACIAFVSMLWDLISCSNVPDPDWYPAKFVDVAKAIEGETKYKPRGGTFKGKYEGPIWKFVDQYVSATYKENTPSLDACDSWFSGAFLLETVPSVLYVLMMHGHDPETAIVRAINDTKDNDTIGAIVGAAVGALHGEKALPMRWRENLLGRTGENDDGRAFELMGLACKKYL
jgi:ADP-ribosyl-[dinitrogen reductase] hydrolase